MLFYVLFVILTCFMWGWFLWIAAIAARHAYRNRYPQTMLGLEDATQFRRHACCTRAILWFCVFMSYPLSRREYNEPEDKKYVDDEEDGMSVQTPRSEGRRLIL